MTAPMLALMLALYGLPPAAVAADAGAAPAAAEPAAPVKWQDWHADNSVKDLASLQRGARNFLNYCNGCHSLKYMRYQRMADDLKISSTVLETELLPPGAKNLDYITTAMPAADAVNWFGKVPPDLSLIARARSPDYIYRFLKSFYLDPATATHSNNLAYPMTAMPAVLSDLGGVNVAVFHGAGDAKVFDHFTTQVPGTLTDAQYDDFVRDTVNFLDYAGEPAQVARRAMGKWVVLFLLLLTWLAWMLKKEYWKDVH
jgi:ubiquinol-cytochrome c reductase cytochrome c1 subunit